MSIDIAWDVCKVCGHVRGAHTKADHPFRLLPAPDAPQVGEGANLVTGGVQGSTTPKATATQVGGTHYTRRVIQPMHYAMVNGYNALQFTVLKYIDRYDAKGTALQDLQKARHAIDMLIEHITNKGTA